jgi:CheY-like chemotaxis protein
MMPGMDGFALAGALRQYPGSADTAIIMLSSGARPDDAVRCQEAGVGLYLTKPIKPSELLDRVLTAMDVEPEREPLPVDVGVTAPKTAARRLRILLAEDNAVNQRLALRVLEPRGHSVVVVSNGEEALAAFEPGEFDVVLMDVEMPTMDGLQATAAIRARERVTGGHVPILAMTAHAMAGDREQCLAANMDGYIAKPLRPRELIAEVEGSVGSETEPPSGAPSGPGTDDILDAPALLARVSGSRDTLRELLDLFEADYPGLLSQARDAALTGDRATLQRAAHSLKGMAATFSAPRALAATVHLEDICREGDAALVEAACREVEQEIECLQPALRALAGEG